MDMSFGMAEWALIVIFAATLVFVWIDGRIKRRAKIRNDAGRCARCEREISPLAHSVAVAGGELFKAHAKVCDACYQKARKIDRALMIVVVAALVLGVVALWL
jgi:intracellular septation protein A